MGRCGPRPTRLTVEVIGLNDLQLSSQLFSAISYGKVIPVSSYLRNIPALVALAAPFVLNAAGPSATQEYKVKAQIIRRLLDWMTWPNAEQGKPLVVAVLEPSQFEDYLLNELQGVVVHGRPVKLRYLRGLSQISQCDLLFIPEDAEASLGSILNGLRGKPIILVGDTPGFAARGLMVNLLVGYDQKIRLEVNESSLRNCGVKLDPLVLQGAVRYR